MARSQSERARARLRAWLAVFFLALSVPGALLVYKAYDQLKWESFRRQQLLAQDLTASVDRGLSDLVRVESERSPEDYGFLLGAGSRRRSTLSALPPPADIPGFLGWFQVGEDGAFSTPWVPGPGVAPAAYGIGPEELARRQVNAAQIEGVLVGNHLVEGAVAPGFAPAVPSPSSPDADLAPASAPVVVLKKEAPAPEPAATKLSQAAFDRLAAPKLQGLAQQKRSAGFARVEDMELDSEFVERERRQVARRDVGPVAGKAAPMGEMAEVAEMAEPRFRESAAAPLELADGFTEEQEAGPAGLAFDEAVAVAQPVAVRLFDTAREPFRLGRMDSGHLVLFRRALLDGEQVIQGLLLDQAAFVAGLLVGPFADSPLSRSTDLTVAHQGDLLSTLRAGSVGAGRASRDYQISAQALSGELLYRTRLAGPFGALELIFSIRRLPAPPGASAIAIIAAALGLVLVLGTWLFWRLGARQIALAGQQQAFVSAVSHELKTPLTSIRMYAEMLRAGFADDGRRETYYRYIQEESERLSRLIANVLQLSRISRGTLSVDPEPTSIAELMAMVSDRVSSPAERARFEIRVDCDGDGRVMADPDAVVQVLINLVDNALKFAADHEPRRVEIGCRRLDKDWWRFSVRDYGPGIPRAGRKRVFQLFYRGESAVHQAVPGTGIGLALVDGLTRAMGGRVSLVDRDPGAELRVDLSAVDE